ncbi:efflux RND transporter permease subunit [Limnochorda pilosa]|nr:efflux RND transporter permease subunit [Limnochorda pilosa]
MKDLRIATDAKSFFAEGDPEIEAFNRVGDRFGGIDSIAVALRAADVFQPDVLRALDRLTAALEQVAGVRTVRSLANIEDLRASEGILEVTPLVTRLPATPEEAEALAARIDSDPLYSGTLVSRDREVALILVQPEPGQNSVDVADRIVRALEPERPSLPEGVTLHLAGMPVLTRDLNEALRRDLGFLVPLTLLLISLILWLGFRTGAGVLLPMSTVLLSVVWTFGLMGHLGMPVSQLGAIVPVLLVSVGSAYGIHMVARYHEECEILSPGAAARERVLRNVGLAVILSGVTTMAGFASNALAPIVRVAEFGTMTAFGVGVALLLSVTWIPALQRSILGAAARPRTRVARWIDSILARLATGGRRHRGLVILATLAVVILSLTGLVRVRTDSNFAYFFPPGNPTREAFDLIAREFGGADTLEVMVEGDIQDPEILRRIAAFEEDLSRSPLIHDPLAITDLLARAQRVMHDDDPAWDRVPETREAAAQYLLLLSFGGRDLLEPLITFDASAAKIQARVDGTDSQARRESLALAEQAVRRHFGDRSHPVTPTPVQVTVTGTPVLGEALVRRVVRSQVQSLAASFIAIFEVMLLLTRSPLHALVTTVPIGLAVLINFGVLGWAGIPLDVITVLVSSIAIGIGIDYSIHVYSRYREERQAGRVVDDALREAVTGAGQAVFLNAAAVVAGFLVLTASAFGPLQYLGGLVSLTMVVSFVSAIAVLPGLLYLVDGRPRVAPARGSRATRDRRA